MLLAKRGRGLAGEQTGTHVPDGGLGPWKRPDCIAIFTPFLPDPN